MLEGLSRNVESDSILTQMRGMRLELEALRRRNTELEKEKKAVEMEREILKKAAVFFAKNLA